MKRKPILERNGKECGYSAPIIEITVFDIDKDILCMSNESYDNDYDAGGLFGQ